MVDAAGTPLIALTGDQLVRNAAHVQKGQTVLVTGAVCLYVMLPWGRSYHKKWSWKSGPGCEQLQITTFKAEVTKGPVLCTWPLFAPRSV